MRQALASLALLFAAVPIVDALLPTALAAAPQGDKKGYHQSPKYGFQFKPPKGWRNIPLKTDESWLAAKYMSDKSYFYTDDKTGYTSEHTPELMVIAFVAENMKRKREVEEESGEGGTVRTIKISNPYKDYEDFLDRTYAGGGWFVDSKEEVKVGNLEATHYTVRVEKLARKGPMFIHTFIFHADGIDFAVQTEILQTEFKKLKSTIDRTYKSFIEIERSGESLEGRGNEGLWITIREMTSGSPKERKSKRMESEEQLHKRAIDSLPGDWDHQTVGDVLILSHTDKKYAKRVGDHANVMLEWFEKTFPYIGKGEYARKPIIRIHKDAEEEGSSGRGVTSGGGGWWFLPGAEIYTHKSNEGWIGSEVDWINRRLWGNWLNDKDSDLENALPQWLSGSLAYYIQDMRSKGKKLEWPDITYDVLEARKRVAMDQKVEPRKLMNMTREEYQQSEGEADRETYISNYNQAAAFVRFLLSKEASKNKYAKDILEKYITTLDVVLEEIRKERDGQEGYEAPKTEAEEEEMAKNRAEEWRRREKELIQTTFERAFGDWGDDEWNSVNEAFYDWLD